MNRRLLGAAFAISLIQSPPAFAESSSPERQTGQACELHAWGAGRPNFKPSARLAAIIAKSNTPEMLDPANPLSNVNLFNPTNRIAALSDAQMKRLLPENAVVTIIRHGTMIDLDETPLGRLQGRLAQSSVGCYADLIMVSSFAILPSVRSSESSQLPNPNSSPLQQALEAPVASLIAGGNRLVIDFLLRDFSASPARPFAIRRKNDSPLPHVQFVTEALRDALIVSANANLQDFADFAARKRRK